ncbi:MAG: succinate dehydrogenase assembly factor 2 [Alphaproteobacteria bacterium]|nr:succinate dehydrogenase assembly factor 2 [Alphaproteobacteria bacterium]
MSLEELENKRKRLIFRSGHRGTKEMDLLMGSFADKYVWEFSEGDLALYEDLLQESDPDIYDWILGRAEPPPEMRHAVFQKLKEHKFA